MDSFCNSSHNFQSLTGKSTICSSSHGLSRIKELLKNFIMEMEIRNNTSIFHFNVMKTDGDINFSITLLLKMKSLLILNKRRAGQIF